MLQGSTQKAVRIALPDIFIASFYETERRLKNAFNRSIKTIRTLMAEKKLQMSLDKIFDRSIVLWTLPTMFINEFPVRTISSSRFSRPVANFVPRYMDEPARWIMHNDQNRGFSIND